MALTPRPIIEYLKHIDADYKEGRVVTPLELRALVWFFVYGQNVFSESGRDWRGATFRQDETVCIMTTKSTRDGIPEVAYTTARTPTDCVVSFCKRWHKDTVEWNFDKYARI
jgi:hypothetical protein